MNSLKMSIFLLLCLTWGVQSQAGCLEDSEVLSLAKGFPTTPVSGLSKITSLEDAYCTQEKYVKLLQRDLGGVAGYKVGFTSKAGQAKFNIPNPATGVLLDEMLLTGDIQLPLAFGYRTLIEPDFLVTIADEKIMQATSARDTLSYVASIHPFIELVAMRLHEQEPVTGNSLVAINIAATKAAIGPAIPVVNSDEFYHKIPKVITRFTNQQGEIIQETDASALMGHPMEVLYWLIQKFKTRGLTLKAGHKISLGATGKLFPLGNEAQRFSYQFIGLSEEPTTLTVALYGDNGAANE